MSKFDFDAGTDRPAWMGTVDFSGLKMKLIASIVAISAIDLLKWFMSIEDTEGLDRANGQLFWLVVIHLSFVLSGVLLALMDWLVSRFRQALRPVPACLPRHGGGRYGRLCQAARPGGGRGPYRGRTSRLPGNRRAARDLARPAALPRRGASLTPRRPLQRPRPSRGVAAK